VLLGYVLAHTHIWAFRGLERRDMAFGAAFAMWPCLVHKGHVLCLMMTFCHSWYRDLIMVRVGYSGAI
jgi:hypothetical protein